MSFFRPIYALVAITALASAPAFVRAQDAVSIPPVPSQTTNDNSTASASTVYADRSAQILLNALSAKAPVASPVFTGAATISTLKPMGDSSTADLSGMMGAASGGIPRTFSERYDDCVNVKDRGAKADLVIDGNNNYVSGTDNTTAFQEAIDRAKSLRKDVCAPGGGYYLAGGLTLDLTGLTRDTDPRPSIRGAGRGLTWLRYGLGAFDAITVTGSGTNAGPHIYSTVSGMRIEKVDVKGAALKLTKTAFLNVDDLMIIGWDVGIDGVDVLSARFRNSSLTSNRIGGRFKKGTFSHPNAISFIDSNIGPNFEIGLTADNPTTFSIQGGEISTNGCMNPAAVIRGGVIITGGPAEGGVGLVSDHAFYEGNCGPGDIQIRASDRPATHTIRANTFNRVHAVDAATNNIHVSGSAVIKVDVQGNAFRKFNDYVASSSRPYIGTSGMTNEGSSLEFSPTNLMDDPTIEGIGLVGWKSYAPVIGAVSGTLGGSSINSATFKRIGATVTFQLDFTITTNDSGSAALTMTLPITPKSGTFPVFSGQVTTTGVGAVAAWKGSTAYVYTSSGTYPGADNARITLSGTYEAK